MCLLGRKICSELDLGLIKVDSKNRVTWQNKKSIDYFKGSFCGVAFDDFLDRFGVLADEKRRVKKIMQKKQNVKIRLRLIIDGREDYFTVQFIFIRLGFLCFTVVVFDKVTSYVRCVEIIQDYRDKSGCYIRELREERNKAVEEKKLLKRKARMDGLTGMYNKQTFEEYLEKLSGQMNRKDDRLQVAMFDIDDFKKVNDTYGHAVGDKVLKRVASCIRGRVTVEDIPARFGGEEFVVILYGKELEESVEILEEIRKSIEDIVHPEMGENVTISIGLCEFFKGGDIKEVVCKADEALYRAKKEGKNRVVVY